MTINCKVKMKSRIVRLFKVGYNITNLDITNHKSQKTKLFHLYYMTLLYDKFSHKEKNKNKYSQNKYLFI